MAGSDLSGRTVVVTGASSGIGQAIAEHVGALGATVWMCGRTAAPMERSAATIADGGGTAEVRAFDIRDIDALQRFVGDAATAGGGLHAIVNNAGFGDSASILDGDPEHWRAMLEVNVLALAVGAQAAVAAMRASGSQGHVINISSVAGLSRDSGMYGATKHAVNVINGTLRRELEDDPIRVTSIMPGPFATNFVRNMDRAMIESVAAIAGIEDPPFDDDGRLPREVLAEVQQRLAPMVGDVAGIARAVEYVLTQPIELNIEEIVIRPQKSLPL